MADNYTDLDNYTETTTVEIVLTDTLPYQPQRSSSPSFEPRVNEISYGNGYEQVSGDGLNANPELWEDIVFILSAAEKDAVLNFFESKGGYIPFKWTSFLFGVEKQYRCTKWRPMALGGGRFKVTATLKQFNGLT